MVSSSSCPPTYRPCEAAAAPPPPPGAPSTWGRYQRRASGSTAQANLRKIIAIITSVFPPLPDPNALQSQLVPPPPPPPVSLEMGESESRVLSGHGMRIDLRLRLGPPSEVGGRISRDKEEDPEAGLPSSACSAVGEEGMTKLTEAGGGSSGVAALETAESGIVSASYDGAHGSGMLDSNSPEEEEKSSEGEWDAQGQGRGRAGEEEVEDSRAEKGEEERGGGEKGGEEREARPCSEITTFRGNTGGRGTEESDATEGGSFVRTEEAAVVREKKKNKSRKMDSDNEADTGRSCRRRDEGYLGLLLEAVRQVSGGDEDPRKQEHAEERREGGRKSRGGPCAAAALDQYEVLVGEDEALGPVVRSKRGRSQALPSRYRDSVLDPWRKYSGGGGGHNRQLQRRQARTAR
ncbi:hypothetical protein Taro_011823 [Colocasia esculenta]|uniref:Uncharacterized protein n=1 Tax=Colocasia esculenta TaxID=4460 RepID=A0A843UBX3_COLES|nr:hypothetical protein [Colocasia esculenta]